MKKSLEMLLIAVVLFNFIFGNSVYAADTTYKGDGETGISSSDLEGLVEDGETSYGKEKTPTKESISSHTGLIEVIVGIIARFLTLFPNIIRFFMYICIETDFTIEKAVFGEIAIFDVNYFNTSIAKDADGNEYYPYSIGTGSFKKDFVSGSSAPLALRKSVAEFYYILRLIAAAISLIILLYVGIRMALATLSSDKAKYKKMLVGWIESILILFFMQYIIAAIFGIGKIFENMIYDLKQFFMVSGDVGFETYILNQVNTFMAGKAGWSYVMYAMIFWMLVGIQTKFFILYFKRLITVGFLILISPIITITYPIDKIGDGKAQAFSVWFNELMMNVFIQPIHGAIYLVFMFTAGEIAKQSTWVALAFLLALTRIEKIILQLFDLKKVTSLKPIDEQREGK